MNETSVSELDVHVARALGGVCIAMTGDVALDTDLQNRALVIAAAAFGIATARVVAVAANRGALYFIERDGGTAIVGTLPPR